MRIYKIRCDADTLLYLMSYAKLVDWHWFDEDTIEALMEVAGDYDDFWRFEQRMIYAVGVKIYGIVPKTGNKPAESPWRHF
jgi:AMMECR1 domain-containing protein